MNDTTDATAIFAPIWRRKWLILAVAIVVAAGSYVYYKHHRATYQATTQIFLGAGAEEQASTEKAGKSHSPNLADQASVINTIIVEQVHRRLRAEHHGAAVRKSKIKAHVPEKSEFITITTETHSAAGAALLANATAQAYIKRLEGKRRAAIEKALAISRRQLRRIELSALKNAQTTAKKPKPAASSSQGTTGASTTETTTPSSAPSASDVIQEANLSSKINALEATLGTVTAEQVKPATAATAVRISPDPRRDALFGFVIGLVLAAIAAYVFSRFDRRLRSLASIEALTGLPLLAALPKVRRPIVATTNSRRPSVHMVEPLRRLETALRIGGTTYATAPSQAAPKTILFVSPDPGDGKSTIVADLALVQRDAGQRVMVVEANFRRPVQNRLLGLEGDGRLADVLTGRLEVDEAAQRVMPSVAPDTLRAEDQGHGVATAVAAELGSLFVLGGDRSVPNPPALLAQPSFGDLLRSLAVRFDYVLIDAPSPLEVSDVLPLLGIVDRIVVVARIGNSREASAQRLRELLSSPSGAPVAGVIANFAAPRELRRYGFSTENGSIWPGGRSPRR
jgi:Mrp family chromosome partitioning ATPase/capsular polysaccharide biosynthesis protein